MLDVTKLVPPVTKDALLPSLEHMTVDFGWPWRSEFTADRNALSTTLRHIRCLNISILRIFSPTALNSDIKAAQACILASDNPSSIHSINFKGMTEAVVADSLISFLSKPPSLKSLSVEVNDEVRIDYGPILTALQWPTSDEDHKDATGENQIVLCPQLSSIKLSRWHVNSHLLSDVVTSRVENSALRHVITENLAFTSDHVPSEGHLDWLEDLERSGAMSSE